MKYFDEETQTWKDIQIKVANAIQNEYGESNNDGYSQNYLNEHTINVGVNSTDYRVNFLKGKNLFNKNDFNDLLGLISDGGTLASNLYIKTLYIKCVPNTTYTVSKIRSTWFRVGGFANVPTVGASYISRIKDDTATSLTYTTPSNCNYLAITYYDGNSDNNLQAILDSIQIEEGNEATSYEPYVDRAITVDGETIYNQDLQNYSTSEKLIGTWIDGKPLYRKCFEKSGLTTGDNTITTGLTIDTLVRLDCNLYRTNGIWHSLTFANSSNLNAVMSITYMTGTISINIGSAITYASKCYVIMEYTKTTETTQNRALSQNNNDGEIVSGQEE